MDEDRGDAERVAQELRAAADADADRTVAAGSSEKPVTEQLRNDVPHGMEASDTGKPVWDVAGALAAVALVVAVFQVAKGLPGVLLSGTCLSALILALAAGHRPVAWQRNLAKAGFFIFLIASVVLFVVTGSTDPQTGSSPVLPATPTPAPTPTPTPVAPSTSTTTTRTPATPTSWEPAEPPRRYVIREGSSVSLFGGGLVVGVTYAFDGWAALTLSTRGPECQPNLEPGRKALIVDPDRNRWYEVRLTDLNGKQVTVSVEWGTGNRPSEPC